MVNTTGSAADQARIRYTVLDAATGLILDSGDIGDAGFDHYQGSIAVNSRGEVVIGYNRSGLEQRDLDGDGLSDGNISLLARIFTTDGSGHLHQFGDEVLLKVSMTDDYHNGSVFGQAAADRQRWGDYSAVSLDPTNDSVFWLIGEFAREYNLSQFGHPGGTGGSRWGTWIASLDLPDDIGRISAPSTWSAALLALAVMAMVRRGRREQAA